MKGKGTKIQANFLPTSSSTNRRTDKNSLDSLKMAVIKYITFSVPSFYQNICYLWRKGCSSYKIRAGCSIIILHTPSQTQLYSYIKDSSHKHKMFLVDTMEFLHLCQVLPPPWESDWIMFYMERRDWGAYGEIWYMTVILQIQDKRLSKKFRTIVKPQMSCLKECIVNQLSKIYSNLLKLVVCKYSSYYKSFCLWSLNSTEGKNTWHRMCTTGLIFFIQTYTNKAHELGISFSDLTFIYN